MEERESFDRRFLVKLVETIEKNLQNEQFSVSELAKESGHSKSQLNRKLKIITGKSPSQFIREYRLKKALELLRDQKVTAAEVAYQVGFGSPSYFSTCFSSFYGYPPSEVARKELKKNRSGKFKLKKERWILSSIISLIGILLVAYAVISSNEPPKELKKDNSIAVLPFKNLSNNQGDQYLADGVQQAIEHHLIRIGDLDLRSKISTALYRETNLNTKEIGEKLQVNYILTGTFQKIDDRALLNVQLIETNTDKLLWSEDYDENWSNIFEIQKKIARKVSEDLYVNISEETAKAFDFIPTKNMKAYELYLQGIAHFSSWWINRDKKKLEEAKNYYQQALKLDENFSLAYTALGEAYGTMANVSAEPKRTEFLNMAKNFLEKAIFLNPYSGWAYAEMETIINTWEWDSAAARKNIETALRLEPNNYNTLNIYFHHEFWLANCDKLESIIEKIARIDPEARKANHHYNLKLLQCQHKYSEIAAIADKYSENIDHIMIARLYLTGYLYTSDYDKAREILDYIKMHSKINWIPLFYGALLDARQGETTQALEKIEKLKSLSSVEQISNIWHARIYATLGDKDMMYQHLELALLDNDWRLHVVNTKPEFFPYQQEDKFLQIWNKSWEHISMNNP